MIKIAAANNNHHFCIVWEGTNSNTKDIIKSAKAPKAAIGHNFVISNQSKYAMRPIVKKIRPGIISTNKKFSRSIPLKTIVMLVKIAWMSTNAK